MAYCAVHAMVGCSHVVHMKSVLSDTRRDVAPQASGIAGDGYGAGSGWYEPAAASESAGKDPWQAFNREDADDSIAGWEDDGGLPHTYSAGALQRAVVPPLSSC